MNYENYLLTLDKIIPLYYEDVHNYIKIYIEYNIKPKNHLPINTKAPQ